MIGTTVSHYRITGTLGGGGMGVVYEAEDERLGRQVAIKFLPESVTDKRAIERFRREAQATSSLNHPHICTLHDVGDHEGRPFFVMERMVGKTLKEHMAGRALAVEEVVRLTDQIADGLAAAHAVGIIHRDLKPTNIFVTDRGDAKLLDFGLVKVNTVSPLDRTIVDSDETASGPLTHPGFAMGTASYMSPEQAVGQTVDERSDIYALGAVMYEMATGTQAHSGGNDVEILYAVLHTTPDLQSQQNEGPPDILESIIKKALEKKPEKRYQSAAELQAVLAPFVKASSTGLSLELMTGAKPLRMARSRRWLMIAAVVVAAVALFVGYRFILGSDTVTVEPEGPSRIAVLPFENIGPSENAYLAEGIAEEVRSKLTSVEGLKVIASSSTRQYSGTHTPPEVVAEELGVQYLLTGSVQWQKGESGEGRVRVTPELVEITSGGAPTIRWQDTLDAPLRDVFHVQTRVAMQVSQALDLALDANPVDEFGVAPTADLDAYDAYLRGLQMSSLVGAIDPISLHDALRHFERAVALDPNFALAWAQLARVSTYLYSVLEPTPEMRDKAKLAAVRASELAPHLALPRLAIGDFYAQVEGDFEAGLEEYAEGLSISPNDPALLSSSGYAEVSLGRWDEALEHLSHAHDLDPRSTLIANRLGFVLLWMRRFEEAREVVTRGLVVSPTDLTLLQTHAMVYLAEGDLESARRVINEPEIDRASLVAYVGTYWGLYWLLDDGQQELLLRLQPSSFGGNRAYWGLVLANTARDRGEDEEVVQRFAIEAEKAFGAMIEASPDDPQLHALHGLNLTLLGQFDEALLEGQRAGELLPISKNAMVGAFVQHVRVKISIYCGDDDTAFDLLEPLFDMPYYLSSGWLRIDPDFERLQDHPRLLKILREHV